MILSVQVTGLVQGVGYRPFVARLAKSLGVNGWVRNCNGIVQIIAEADPLILEQFTRDLKDKAPVGAMVEQVISALDAPQPLEGFHIVKSETNPLVTTVSPVIAADVATCHHCLAEMKDRHNRRYRHPFISCVDCGPRYSILHKLPYDRENTAMATFPLCPSCQQEYFGEQNLDMDRRLHAQTVACKDCGPSLFYKIGDNSYEEDQALQKAVASLKEGNIIALKGIGGYQFVCSPYYPKAVKRLRAIKLRDYKAFAIMFPDLNGIIEYCSVSPQESALLTSSARPIVLLQPIAQDKLATQGLGELESPQPFCKEVSGDSRFIGAFLACTALHQLLLDDCGPLVMTSANLSDEPIIFKDDAIKEVLPSDIGILSHNREIVTPLDDSVTRVIDGKTQMIRRSRGYVPLPISLKNNTKQTILAFGGDLKSSFCLLKDDQAYVSQYFGDMDSYGVSRNYQENLTRMENLLGLKPTVLACDLHPNYNTSHMAHKLSNKARRSQSKSSLPLVEVQHHHAHVASVMAEHHLESCIGVAFDGTGYGTDGAIWGGEFLLCEGGDYRRLGHLTYVTLCGSDEAAKNANLTASCYLLAANQETSSLPVKDSALIKAALAQKDLSFRSSSMGRLFDAVSSILDICTLNSYEGECAILLENKAAEAQKAGIEPYPLHFAMEQGEIIQANPVPLLLEVFRASRKGVSRQALALGFHQAIIDLVLAVCCRIRHKEGENNVALSGGVFANLILIEGLIHALEEEGFAVYMNQAVPPNDGCLALGQAFVCGQKMK